MLDIGRVAVTPKGEYNPSTTYTRLDSVIYQDTVYIGTKDVIPVGTLPTNTSYWEVMLSSSKPIVTLTKAEYDALPDSKLTNNIVYFISDSN